MNEVEPKIKIENISGRAFLAFPDQTEMLLTEMIERLHIVSKPTHIYGDLLYFANGVGRLRGLRRSDYADMSNDKTGEKPVRRKPKDSWVKVIFPGLVGP